MSSCLRGTMLWQSPFTACLSIEAGLPGLVSPFWTNIGYGYGILAHVCQQVLLVWKEYLVYIHLVDVPASSSSSSSSEWCPEFGRWGKTASEYTFNWMMHVRFVFCAFQSWRLVKKKIARVKFAIFVFSTCTFDEGCKIDSYHVFAHWPVTLRSMHGQVITSGSGVSYVFGIVCHAMIIWDTFEYSWMKQVSHSTNRVFNF